MRKIFTINDLLGDRDPVVTFSDLMEERYSHVLVLVDANNQVVGNVEMIKDTNEELDAEVDRFLRVKEIMVVVEG